MTIAENVARRRYGLYLRNCREYANIPLEEAAEASNVSVEHVRAFEAGEAIPPHDVLARLAKLYNVPLGLLTPDDIDRLLVMALYDVGSEAI